MELPLKAKTAYVVGLEAELATIRERIRALEFAVACARVLATREHNLSNLGWMLSMALGAVGTLVAVTRSQREDVFVDELHDLEMALVKLWMDKKILLREIDSAQRRQAIEAPRR
ncbi:MAG: hypothetical protein K0V04_28110 [Deltaproteobacteria bacterium]|nr:hypothetical protein [Deltaproteobacteria bacterium]